MNLIDLKKNPELIPVIEWWEKDGKQTVICILVAVAAVAGWYGWKHHRASERAAASAAIAEANAPADLEDAVAKFSGSAAEPALEIKLAKSYYDDGRYEEALARYEEMSGKVRSRPSTASRRPTPRATWRSRRSWARRGASPSPAIRRRRSSASRRSRRNARATKSPRAGWRPPKTRSSGSPRSRRSDRGG